MPSFVQKLDGVLFGTGSFTSATQAFPSGNTAGDLLIAVVSWFNAAVSGSNAVTVAVTDSKGNTWHSLPLRHSIAAADEIVQFWYCLNCAAGANTVTFTFSAGASFGGAFIGEWSGVNAIDNYDNEADTNSFVGTGTAVSATNSRVAATHDSTELVLAYAQSNNYSNWTVSSPWTLRSTASSIQVGVADQNAGNGTYFGAFTLNSSSRWATGTVTFYQTDSSHFVQEIDHDDGVVTPATTDSMTFPRANSSGNLLFLLLVWLGNSGGNISISSVTDTQGNTLVALPRVTVDATGGPGGFGPTYAQAWYCLGCAAGANTVTAHFSAGATFIGGSLSEWSGVHYLDSSAQTAIHNATATSPSITTRVASELLIGYAATEDGFCNVTPAASYTARTSNHRSVWLQSQIGVGLGTYNSAPTGDGGNLGTNLWMSGIAAFSATPPPLTGAKPVVCIMQ